MRSFITPAIVAMLAAATMVGAQAQTRTSVYVYNFNDASTTGTSAANAALLFSVDKNNSSNANGSFLTSTFNIANVVSFGGTTANADNGDVAGAALALQGGGATGAIANNGGFLTATADLTGFSNINLSFAIQGTATGFTNDQFQYSLDGTTFTNFGAPIVPVTSFAVPVGTGVVPAGAIQTFDLSGVAGLANNNSAAFRLVFNGATSTGGNNRIDNLIISGTQAGTPPAVPEASTTLSFGLLLALGMGGIVVARRKQSSKQA